MLGVGILSCGGETVPARSVSPFPFVADLGDTRENAASIAVPAITSGVSKV
jgi:hypothetical protein